MRILGAKFERDAEAFAALRELRARFDLGDEDVAIRPLGTTHYERPTSDLIVAGRFRPEVLPEVVAVLKGLGGELVVDREEPPTSPLPRPADEALGRGGAGASEIDLFSLRRFQRG
jgi:hypothetical protein